MVEFFRIGGYSMFAVLACGLAGLLVALYATGRPSEPRIVLAKRLAIAELFFALSGYASNVAMTLVTVAEENPPGDGFRVMLATGLYESLSPVIMGLSFIALTELAVAIAAYRLARGTP